MKRILVEAQMQRVYGIDAYVIPDGKMFICEHFVEGALKIDAMPGERVVFEFRRRRFSGSVLVYLPPRPKGVSAFRWSLLPKIEWCECGVMWGPMNDLLVRLGAKRVVYVKGTKA